MMSLDFRIKQLRREFTNSRDDDEAMEILIRISELQKQRFREQGSFLPMADGRNFYFDLDYQRWFEIPKKVVIDV